MSSPNGSNWSPPSSYLHMAPPMFTPYPSATELIVPQRPYSANIQRNHTTCIPIIEFYVNGQKGINLGDAANRIFSGLAHAEDKLLEGFGTKVTYRLEWPGYMGFNKQKHALRATRVKESITRSKMAIHVAEVMKEFIETNLNVQENAPQPTNDPNWRVGNGFIELSDLYLLEIHQVSKASLQPVIAYRPRYAAHAAQLHPGIHRGFVPMGPY
ncbi:hypothetical protein PHLGIDRAFT_37731 [Phlebiopsis gigantea 11061_1 CR5-6]|uniref:Uncharacterized protein n=1 Tax=Phlebiopsis gigantea (strain 11061_1 CR5-6) TaxID=745531 RepID=A0A0C3RRP3_PHLG1|nr:hypothetical protein PHLGIDRAFT_37731 [Phlebiopsis gigantea 11061_1 CR5-6]